jgi:hypothetical protein
MFNIFTRSSTRFVATAVALWTVGVLFVACGGGADSPTSPSTITTPTTTTTTTTTSGGTTTSTTTSTPLAYVNDIKPVLDSDCVACHSPRLHESNVDLSTYASVMRVVQAGSSNSLLVRVTRSNGIMYPNLTGNRAAKSELIRSWVVDSLAAETR